MRWDSNADMSVWAPPLLHNLATAMADFVPLKKLRGEGGESVTSWPLPRLCRRCKQTFDPRNAQEFCVFHR